MIAKHWRAVRPYVAGLTDVRPPARRVLVATITQEYTEPCQVGEPSLGAETMTEDDPKRPPPERVFAIVDQVTGDPKRN